MFTINYICNDVGRIYKSKKKDLKIALIDLRDLEIKKDKKNEGVSIEILRIREDGLELI